VDEPKKSPAQAEKIARFECSGCGHLSFYHKSEEGCLWPDCKCKRVIIPLTPREYEVLRLVASGDSNQDAGMKLGLTAKTIEVHITNMRKKTGMHSTKNLILASLRCGILTLNDLPAFDAIISAD
jgi:DNA-binding CsgD family transcriptional regulator